MAVEAETWLAGQPKNDRGKVDNSGGAMYTIEAYYPSTIKEPLRIRSGRLKEATRKALELQSAQRYTTISVRTPDGVELVKLWGQPMPNGKWWP